MKWIFTLVLAITGCGASTAQVVAAKKAEYRTTPTDIFQIAMHVAEQKYVIGEVDEAGYRFATRMQFYRADGARQSAGAEGVTMVGAGSVGVQFFCEVVQQGGVVRLVVTPKTIQVVAGSPQPRELRPDDPNLPPWVHGRVDALYVAVHERAKKFETTSQVRQVPPAPE